MIGVPLAVPLAVLVFFGAFVPIIGAFVSGFVAVVVALATRGVVAALVVLVAIIVIQQVEGHLLQPLVMGRLVRLHPLGVVLAVTAGSVLAGLVGAVVAVPLAAVADDGVRLLRRRGRVPRCDRPPEVTLIRSVCHSRTMSRTDRMPATSPSSSTTRCRKPPRSMASAACSRVQSGDA